MEIGGERPTPPRVTGQRERGGSSPIGKAVTSFVSIIERLRVGLAEEKRYTEAHYGNFHPQWWMYSKLIEGVAGMAHAHDPEEIRDFFIDVSRAYGILAYPQLHPIHKAVFRKNLLRDKEVYERDRISLTDQQSNLLVQITTATNVPYNPEQHAFFFSTVLDQPEPTDEELMQPGW